MNPEPTTRRTGEAGAGTIEYSLVIFLLAAAAIVGLILVGLETLGLTDGYKLF